MIDIEKERERWAHWAQCKDVGQYHADLADDYLDELESTRFRVEELEKANDHLKAELSRKDRGGWDFVGKLQDQLADQRAQAIRMMAFHRAAYHGYEPGEPDVYLAAAAYDRLAAIQVPPPASEVGRG